MSDAFWRGWIRGAGEGGILGGSALVAISAVFQPPNWQGCVFIGALAYIWGVLNLIYLERFIKG